MDDDAPSDLEKDLRFPSGAWTGFYLQYWLPGRHDTSLQLTFDSGALTGDGSDHVGQFTIDGSYDVRTGRCQWTKQYLGRHSIAYRGVSQGVGIWGVWELKQLGGLLTDRGGFHIWPLGADAGAESDEAEAALLEVMSKEFGNKMIRAVYVLFTFIVLAAMSAGLFFMLKSLFGR